MDLNDKVVLITGASSGIGLELARQCARKGGRVVLAARSADVIEAEAASLRADGFKAFAVAADVSSRPSVEAMVAAAVSHFGRLDVLINNAGVSTANGTLMENDEKDVRFTLDVNLMGGIYGVWAAVPAMEKVGGGVIVFVSSCIGKRGVPLNAVYCASKFAVQGLTEAIRLELRAKNIRVLTVCPPGVATPFFAKNGKGEQRTHRLHPVDKIAALVVDACEREQRESLLTIDSKLLHWANVFFPGLSDWLIAKNKGV